MNLVLEYMEVSSSETTSSAQTIISWMSSYLTFLNIIFCCNDILCTIMPTPSVNQEKCILNMNHKDKQCGTSACTDTVKILCDKAHLCTFFCVCLGRSWRTYFLGSIPWNHSGITPLLKTGWCCVWSVPPKLIISSKSLSKRSQKPAKTHQKCLRQTQSLGFNGLKMQLKHYQVRNILLL